MPLLIGRLDTSIGEMLIVTDHEEQLRAADWADYETRMNRLLRLHYGTSGLKLERCNGCDQQILSGRSRRHRHVPVKTGGTPFQDDVWRALRDIPCGTTVSYMELAKQIGRPAAVRAG